MNYSLGNMLSRGGALNPDGLSLDLAFATDKTLTARKGPTPTFTRASTATFVGSDGLIQSAAINTPRFDYDPVTLACKGLLIEESRTNAALRSEALVANNGWAAFGVTTAIGGTSPTGSTAYEVTETAGASTHTLVNTGGLTALTVTSVTSGLVYTGSIFLKKSTVDWVQLTFGGTGFGSTQYANFDLATGAVGNSAGMASGTTPRIEAFPNGWYRCSISVAATTTTSLTAGLVLALVDNTNSASRTPGYNGSTSNKVFAWGAQFEVGSFHTSYIPTTTTALTRSADVCSITGGDFTGFWNQSAGTLVQVFEASPNTNTTYVAASNGNIAANSVHIDNDTGLMRSVYYSGSSNVATLDLGAVGTVGSVNKVATAYSVNDFAASRNGGSVVTDTSGALPIGLSQMNIGADERSQVPTSFFSNKCISSLRYYNKRLPNAKLQSLTT